MVCEYTTTYDDFKAAQRLHLRRRLPGHLSFFLCLRVGPVVACISGIFLLKEMFSDHFRIPAGLADLMFAIVIIGFYFPVRRALEFRRLYKRMKAGSDRDQRIQLELTETELILRKPGKTEVRFLPARFSTLLKMSELA